MINLSHAITIVLDVLKALSGKAAAPSQRLREFGYTSEESLRYLADNFANHPLGVRGHGYRLNPRALSAMKPDWTVRSVARALEDYAVSIED